MAEIIYTNGIPISTIHRTNDKLIAKGWLREIDKLSDVDIIATKEAFQDIL